MPNDVSGGGAPPRLRVCVLQSSYEGSQSDTKAYDDYACTPAYVVGKSPLADEYEFTSVMIKKATAYSQVRCDPSAVSFHVPSPTTE